MKNIVKKELINKICFSLILINFLGIIFLAFLNFKANNKIQEATKTKQEQAKIEKEKAEEQEEEEKQTKEEIKQENNTVESLPILENLILLNKNEITPYNAFDNKKTDFNEIEIISKSFYKLFNTKSLKEYVNNFNNFSFDIGGMFSPGYENLTDEQLNAPFELKEKVIILIDPHNIYKEYTVFIFAGEKSNQRFFMFNVSVNDKNKIRIEPNFQNGTIENIGGID